MLVLMTIISILIKVYCYDDTNVERIPFPQKELIVPMRKYYEQHSKKIPKLNNSVMISDEAPRITPINYCSSFKTCLECVKSYLYPCDWCHNFGCVNIGDKLCPYVIALKNSNQNIMKMCPYIQYHGSIMLPSGQRTLIDVKMQAPDPITYSMRIICQLKLKNRLTHMKGFVLKNWVYCYPIKVDTRETLIGSFSLIWGGVDPYSNEVPVTVYNCEVLAYNCESCRILPQAFECGWCNSQNSCMTACACNDLMTWSQNKVRCSSDKPKQFLIDFVTPASHRTTGRQLIIHHVGEITDIHNILDGR